MVLAEAILIFFIYFLKHNILIICLNMQPLKAVFLWLLNLKLIHEGTEGPVCSEPYAD